MFFFINTLFFSESVNFSNPRFFELLCRSLGSSKNRGSTVITFTIEIFDAKLQLLCNFFCTRRLVIGNSNVTWTLRKMPYFHLIFLIWKFCGKPQFPHSFGRIAESQAFFVGLIHGVGEGGLYMMCLEFFTPVMYISRKRNGIRQKSNVLPAKRSFLLYLPTHFRYAKCNTLQKFPLWTSYS